MPGDSLVAYQFVGDHLFRIQLSDRISGHGLNGTDLDRSLGSELALLEKYKQELDRVVEELGFKIRHPDGREQRPRLSSFFMGLGQLGREPFSYNWRGLAKGPRVLHRGLRLPC